jgi:hypothetical protein
MKQTILMLCLCGGLIVAGCDSNKRSSKAFGKKNSSAAAKPASSKNTQATANSSNNSSNTVTKSGSAKTKLDSLLMEEERSNNSRPRTYYQGSTGVGTGGSYASHAYRHDEMNKQKYEKKALARQERNLMIQQARAEVDSLNAQTELQNTPADSLNDAPVDSMQFSKK